MHSLARLPSSAYGSGRGFSIVEMAIVSALLAILVLVAAPRMQASTDGVVADMITRVADASASNWELITGTTQTDAGVPQALAYGAYTLSDMLFLGSGAMNPQYRNAVNLTPFTPLSALVIPDPAAPYGTTGQYVLAGMSGVKVQVVATSSTQLTFTFTNAPVKIAAILAQRVAGAQPPSTYPATVTAGPNLSYTCADAFGCTITMTRRIQ